MRGARPVRDEVFIATGRLGDETFRPERDAPASYERLLPTFRPAREMPFKPLAHAHRLGLFRTLRVCFRQEKKLYSVANTGAS